MADNVVVHDREIATLTDCTARFAGTADEDVFGFIDKIGNYIFATKITPEEALMQLPLVLDGVAAEWWRCYRHHVRTWEEAMNEFLKHFGRSRKTIKLIEQLRCRRQQPGETAQGYINDMLAIMNRMDPPLHDQHQASIIVAGLMPSVIPPLAQALRKEESCHLNETTKDIIMIADDRQMIHKLLPPVLTKIIANWPAYQDNPISRK